MGPFRGYARRRLLKLGRGRVLLWAAAAIAAWGAFELLTLPDVTHLASQNPTVTALIQQRVKEAADEGRKLNPVLRWVRLEDISPHLVSAVVLSEDAAFFGHEGFDWDELKESVKKNLKTGRYARGGSTLTQQLAKNLFLGTRKSLWRKAKEAVLAYRLERALSKRRILALYLNVVEWGEGVFGIEAGARARLGQSARSLSPAQAALMAAMLPAPRKADVAQASESLQRRTWRVLHLLHHAKKISASELAFASLELKQLFRLLPPEEKGEAPDPEELADLPPGAGDEPGPPREKPLEAPEPLPASSPAEDEAAPEAGAE